MKQEKDEMPSGVYRSWGFREIKRRRQEEGRIWDVSQFSTVLKLRLIVEACDYVTTFRMER